MALDMKTYYIDYLLVGGGGGGGSAPRYNGGGGGGGEVRFGGMLVPSTFNVVVGQGGEGGTCMSKAPDGCPSCLWWLRANGGGGGDSRNVLHCCRGAGKSGTNYWWSSEYRGSILCYGPGGGGAGTSSASHLGGYGVNGYGGGGNGGTNYSCTQTNIDGGGIGACGARAGCNAVNYGGGGGGGNTGRRGGAGCQGIVDICYPSDGSYGFTTATGGNCCYTCNGICVHRFTSNGTFTIVS